MNKQNNVTVDANMAGQMGLSREEYDMILQQLGRTPNVTELSLFSAMWSEHCCYKNSKKLFSLFPTRAKHILVGAGEENTGVVDIGDGLGIAFKMESHNHPSAIEPFEASATGIGGCLRDIFTMGAVPIAVLSSLRFGRLDNERVRFLFREIFRGLAHYANNSKVSAVGGEACFDESYEGNPLVNAFVLGVVPHQNLVRGTTAGVGKTVYYIGGATGRDGVGGASFASQDITEDAASSSGAVAIGDPELGRRLREACLELIGKGLVAGMQDMGAAGLICSTSESASRGKTGIEFDVSRVPQQEAKMTPSEILLSESQERMLLVLQEDAEDEAIQILKKWNISFAAIGVVTHDGMIRIKEGGDVVAEVPAQALTDNAPLYDRPIQEPQYLKDAQDLALAEIPEPSDGNKVLLALLDSPTIASKEAAYRSFTFRDDGVVAVGPGSDAAVVRVPGSPKALAISVDGNGRYCYLNPYQGAMLTVAEAARNVVCAGGRPLAITDGLNFGNPMKPENYWQFQKCIEGLADACRALETPVISGNVSFYNESPKGAIDPTPMVGMVGLIEDAARYVTQEFKSDGDAIVLMGYPAGKLDGSEYLHAIHGQKRGNPKIDIEFEKCVQAACLDAIEAGLVKSAHDCSDGGLAVCLAESCMSNPSAMRGAHVDVMVLASQGIRLDEILFGEAPSRIVFSVAQNDFVRLEQVAAKHRVPLFRLGTVGTDRLVIQNDDATVIDLSVNSLSDTWRSSIPAKTGLSTDSA